MFAGISMGCTTDKEGHFKMHFPDEPIMIKVYDHTDDQPYYVKVNAEDQALNIKLDKAAKDASIKSFKEWSKNGPYNSDHISQVFQSEEFYEYVHKGSEYVYKGQRRGDAEVAIDEPVSNPAPRDKDAIYTAVEKFGGLKGAITDWNAYVAANLKYPAKAKADGVNGKVFVSFVIEKDGSTSSFKVIKGVREDCDREAIRLVKESKWNPALMADKPVRCAFTVPIDFTQ
jgi:TonB family protein